MLFAIDIGNTSTSFGLFEGKRLVKYFRTTTQTSGGTGGLRASAGGGRTKETPRDRTRSLSCGVVIASVVPKLDKQVAKSIKKKCGTTPIFVDYKNCGMKIGYPKPREIGADRLANAVAAWERYKKACIVVDFGTATTLDYIDGKGVYWGGTIAPGIGMGCEALALRAAKLPKVKIKTTSKMIPTSTVSAMQAGIYQGHIGLIKHLIKTTIGEVGGRPKVIATGGFAPLMAKGTDIFDAVEPFLTLEGLRIIWTRNL